MSASASPLDSIEVPSLELPCRIGVAPRESERPQTLRVGLTLYLALGEAAGSGELGDTVDYARLVDRVEELVGGRVWGLLESLAEEIASLALREPGVGRVVIGVTKLQPPWPVSRGPVTVRLERVAGGED